MKTYAELLNFPGGGIQAIIGQVEEYYLETDYLEASDNAYIVLTSLKKLAANAKLLDDGDDIVFFVAVIDIIKLNDSISNLNLNTMVVDIKRGIPIEQSLEHSLQLVEVLEKAKLLYGRYNERFKLLINSKFRKARMDIMREELIMAVLEPTRVMRYFDMGYDILDDVYLSDFP
jgi:hypothetical protein